MINTRAPDGANNAYRLTIAGFCFTAGIEALYVSGLQDNDCVLRIFASFNILVRISSSPPTRSKHKYPSKRADSE